MGAIGFNAFGWNGWHRPLMATLFFYLMLFGRPSAVNAQTPARGAKGAGEGALSELSALDQAAFEKMLDEALKKREDAKKKEEETKKCQDGVAIGSNLTLTGSWVSTASAPGFYFQTPNKDWSIHVGGRIMFQSDWWQEPASLKGTPPGNGGVPDQTAGGGVGVFQDGMFFRRVRLRAEGVGYETVEFVEEIDFEQLNFIAFDHLWVGMKDIPILGTVRIGQHKVPQGLEMISSDYHLTFLERSALSEAFWTLFAPGIFIANTYLDQHVTFQTMFHKVQPFQFYNAQFGDGDYAESTRLTGTPVYANEGRDVVHLGGSYQWRHGNLGSTIIPNGTGNTFGDTQSAVIFRSRPEIRDSTGIVANLSPGNAARLVSTGFLQANSVQTVSPEFLWIRGPFSVQAEGAFAFVENCRQLYPTADFNTSRGNPMFWGSYIQASYFLTGEHRGYDRRFGMFDRPTVNENAFAVRDENGRCVHGIGAWELAYRFSYLDLNSNGVNGGTLGQHTVGLNWYLNDNFKIQFNYLNANRQVIGPASSGTIQGLGVLTEWYF